MPRLEFWYSDHESIAWTFNRHPDIGEEVVLGDRGVYRVTGPRPERLVPNDVTAYNCERVRDATHGDIDAMLKRGVNRLPPP